MRQSLPSSFLTPEKTRNSVQIKLNGFSPTKLEPCLEQTLELIYFPPTLFSTQKLNGGPVLLLKPLKCSLDSSCYFLQTVLETSLYFPSYFRSFNPLLLFPLLPLTLDVIQSPIEMSESLGWKVFAAAIMIVPGTKF